MWASIIQEPPGWFKGSRGWTVASSLPTCEQCRYPGMTTPSQPFGEGFMPHTFPVLMVASHSSCSCHCTQSHLSSTIVPKVQQQTKSCSGSHVNTNSQSRRFLSICFWEAAGSKVPSIFRLCHQDGPGRMLSDRTGTLRMIPGCREVAGVRNARKRV